VSFCVDAGTDQVDYMANNSYYHLNKASVDHPHTTKAGICTNVKGKTL